MTTFKKIVNTIQKASGSKFSSYWAPRITEIVERTLGKNKKVNDMSREQVEQLAIIVDELTSAIENGI